MLFLFVGTLNRAAPYFAHANGTGLVVYGFDEASLSAEKLTEATDVDNPSYLTVNRAGTRVYATSEVFGWKEGVVSAYAFDQTGHTLTYLDKQVTLGSISAHSSLDAAERHLYVANYAMGSGGPDRAIAVFPVQADGSIAPALASHRLSGSGPDAARQERSHAHCVLQLPDGSVLVTDLGTDLVHRFRLEGRTLREIGRLAMAPGAGPRHIALTRDGRIAYVMNELNSTVTAMAVDGELRALATTPTLPPGLAEGTISADIHLSPDGRFLYTSSRGADRISVLRIGGDDGTLELLETLSTNGRTPRNFTLTPSGRHLLVANQDSDSIVILARDAESGLLTDTGRSIAVGTPMCVKLVPQS